MRDVLLTGGRVLDPGSGRDEVADVLISRRVIAAVGRGLHAPEARVIDASDLIVGPGFVDLHSHVHSIVGQRVQAFDGVTTALDLEAGLAPVDVAYRAAAAAGRPLNYGFSASWASARAEILLGIPPDPVPEHSNRLFGIPTWQRSSSKRELADWLSVLESELAQGALGIGVLLGYAPRTAPGEFLEVARLAARFGAPTFTHVRELIEADPTTPIDGSSEIVVAGLETGAAMHHCHVNSTSRRHIDRVLSHLERGRAGGARITLEAYPYGAGATSIGAAFLDPERLPAWGIKASDLVLIATRERVVDDDRLRALRTLDPTALCMVEFLDESSPTDLALLDTSLGFTDTIVASDGGGVFLPDGNQDTPEWPVPLGTITHPRTAGTFTKSLRRMVRETGRWTWLEAFRRCSYLPARILDDLAPAMRGKGHLSPGADADVVVLDPATVSDAATFDEPLQTSVGVRHLFVNGVPLISDGKLDPTAMPGRPVRGEPGARNGGVDALDWASARPIPRNEDTRP